MAPWTLEDSVFSYSFVGSCYTHSVDVAMVKNCCVVGCKNCVGKKQNFRFFRFLLTDKVRCEKWPAAVRRARWQPVKSSRICNEHFVTGMKLYS